MALREVWNGLRTAWKFIEWFYFCSFSTRVDIAEYNEFYKKKKPKPERNLCKNERKNKIEGGEPHTNFFTSNFVLITKIRYISNFSTYTRFINFNVRKQDHKIIIVWWHKHL